jgi:hypothetical protein
MGRPQASLQMKDGKKTKNHISFYSSCSPALILKGEESAFAAFVFNKAKCWHQNLNRVVNFCIPSAERANSLIIWLV